MTNVKVVKNSVLVISVNMNSQAASGGSSTPKDRRQNRVFTAITPELNFSKHMNSGCLPSQVRSSSSSLCIFSGFIFKLTLLFYADLIAKFTEL